MLKKIAVLISISFVILSCGGILKPVPPEIIDIKAIQYTKSGAEQIVDFTAEKVMSKRKFDVYLKRGVTVNVSLFTNQIDKFSRVYNDIVQTFGEHTDMDKNEKILVVFFDINSGVVPAGGSYIGGYFNKGDLASGSGNSAEIIYIDAYNGLATAASTMVHELQHLINYNKNDLENSIASYTWANEALSAASEIVYEGKIPAERLSYFNNDKENLIKNGDYFYSWLDGGSLADYSTVSLFMYWLYTHGNGKEIFYNIAVDSSPPNKGKYGAFVEAVGKNTSMNSLNTWDKILETWFTANVKNAPVGLEGYLKTITPVVRVSSGDKKLYPGDVVYSSSSISGGGITKTITGSPTSINRFAYNNSTIVETKSSALTPVSVHVTSKSSDVYSSMSYSDAVDTGGPYKRDAVLSIDTRGNTNSNETNK